MSESFMEFAHLWFRVMAQHVQGTVKW